MKVALVLERFDWRKGGLESWTWQFAQILKRRGCDVHVVAFDFHPEAEQMGIVPHQIDRPRSRLARAAALEQCLRNVKADVIHDMGAGWYADVFHPHGGSILATRRNNWLRIPRWRRIKFWTTRREREIREIEVRQNTRPGSVTVAVSEMVKGHLVSMNGMPPEKIRVIYNGVDLQKFTPAHRTDYRAATRAELDLKEGEVAFFLLAHNLALKNAATLIRAMGLLAARNLPARLVIAGGDNSGPFRRLAEKVGAAGRVTFLGLVKPVQYYAATDVAVLPTWYDPCSLFTLEAWSAGLPVITTRYNGASALMREGVEGFTLDDPADPVALAARMEKLLDANTLVFMSHAARALAEQHSFEKQADEFMQLYREIIDRRK